MKILFALLTVNETFEPYESVSLHDNQILRIGRKLCNACGMGTQNFSYSDMAVI